MLNPRPFVDNILKGFFIASVLALGACASPPKDAERITFASSNPVWFDELQSTVKPVKGRGYLVVPQTGHGPYPAVIILHTSQGLGTTEWSFAKKLVAEDIAVLAIDSFGPRGVVKIDGRQTQVSEAAILKDLYAARDRLLRDQRIDGQHIAVLGLSKGALPAVYSAFNEIDRMYNPTGPKFVAHVGFHPWCGLRLADLTMTGAPVQIHSGGDDTITPPALCRDLMNAAMASDPEARVEMNVYPGARHAFEHPVLQNLPPLAVTYEVPRNCRIVEQLDGTFIEASRGKRIDSKTFGDVISACSEKGATVEGNPEAAEKAIGRTLSFLKKALKETPGRLASLYISGQ